MLNKTNRLTVVAITTMISTLSITSQAQAAEKTFMEKIPFTAQELTTKTGVANVHGRVLDAAEKICVGDDISIANRLLKVDVENCVNDVVEKALAPQQYAILASFNGSIQNPAKGLSKRQLAKNSWTIEKFQMAQMEMPKIDVLP